MGPGFQHQLRGLGADGSGNLSPRSTAKTWGYGWAGHSILRIYGGQPADTRYMGVQWGCPVLVIPTMTYAGKVPVVASSKIIDRAMKVITKWSWPGQERLERQGHFGVVMSGSCQLPWHHAKEDGALAKGAPLSASSGSTAHKEFCLDDVQGHVHTTQKVTIPPFGIVNVHGETDVQGHCM